MRDMKKFTSKEISGQLEKDGQSLSLYVYQKAGEREQKPSVKIWPNALTVRCFCNCGPLPVKKGLQKVNIAAQNPALRVKTLKHRVNKSDARVKSSARRAKSSEGRAKSSNVGVLKSGGTSEVPP